MSQEIFERFGSHPIPLCQSWLAEATAAEINDPEAACLATCDSMGRPSARMILIKSIDEAGFKFHTNAESHKGRDMAENPVGALCLYWKSLRKQIRVEGVIEKVPETEADAYFSTRPIERQIGAWASKQSTPFEHLADLESAVKKYETKFAGAESIPRPPYWQGYRLIPQRIEFWIAHEHRLHTRFVYTRAHDGAWDAAWLCP